MYFCHSFTTLCFPLKIIWNCEKLQEKISARCQKRSGVSWLTQEHNSTRRTRWRSWWTTQEISKYWSVQALVLLKSQAVRFFSFFSPPPPPPLFFLIKCTIVIPHKIHFIILTIDTSFTFSPPFKWEKKNHCERVYRFHFLAEMSWFVLHN